MDAIIEDGICDDGCSWMNELGPPPDLILSLPPPPLPFFLEEALRDIVGDENQSCHLCDWSKGVDSVNFVELVTQGTVAEEAWFFVILTASLIFALGVALFAIICFRLRWRRMKSVSELEKTKQKVTDFYNPAAMAAIPVLPVGPSRALWAGLKATEENHYTIAHVQPVDQKKHDPIVVPEYDYGSVGYTSLTPDTSITFVNTAATAKDIHYMSTDVVRMPAFDNCGFSDDHAHSAACNLSSYPTGWRLVAEANAPRQPVMYETVVKTNQCVLVKRSESTKSRSPRVGTLERAKKTVSPPILMANNLPALNARSLRRNEDEYAAPCSPVYAEPELPAVRQKTLERVSGRSLATAERKRNSPVLFRGLNGTLNEVPTSPLV